MSESRPGPERERQLLDLLTRALALPPGARAGFVTEAAGDPVLAADVLELLAGEPQLAGFLERPPLDRITTGSPGDSTPESEERIGAFRLLRQLGAGGMGQVFLAVQTEPVERRVALKLMQPALSSPEGRARFQAERQALARLSHVNVAQLYESGTTADGRLFFAMELIEGRPITEYCDSRRLDVDERLQLFAAVCAGAQHAHEHRLVHRDLKPSNVLVSDADGRAVPKIIDFGIAKALDRPLTETPALTGRWFPGAPAYTSPEALERGASTLDVRSDVYSLGVLLYELIAGVRPFEEEDASPVEILRRIQEVEPRRPSACLASLRPEAAEDVAAARRTTPPTLQHRLLGDLDWIVLRAMAKRRDERYQSAAALARDVERHLADEPVEASPPGRVYRMRKFLRRHRLAAGAGAALALVLAVAAAALLVTLSRARSAEQAAAALASRPLAPPIEPRPITSEIGVFWSPRLSPDARRLVYVRRTEDSADLILRTVADGRETPLRASPANEYSPAWSPDGSAVAFLREGPADGAGLLVIDVASGLERTIAHVNAPPFGFAHLTPPHVDWSPDGAYLVVPDRANDGSPYRLALVAVADGARTYLTDPPGHDWGDTSARFSPDGTRLLVARHESATSHELLIYGFDPAHGLVGAPRRVSAVDGEAVQEPAWTPDGSRILFTSGLESRLWIAPAASPERARRLSYTAPRVRMPDVRAGADGRWRFAFVLNDHDIDIVRVPLLHDGGAPRAAAARWRTVGRSVGIDARPALSPDGRQMAFTSDRTGSLQIWIADLEGGGVRQLTRLPATPLGHLHWSPDGSRIAFTTTLANERGRDLFTARVSDGTVEPIVQRDMDDKWQWWSPDGRFLHFVGGPDGATKVWRVPSGGGDPVILYDRNAGGLRERPGGGYVLVDGGFWALPASLDGSPERLTDVEPYDNTSFDVTAGGVYFVTGDRRLLHYGFGSRRLTTVAELPSPVRAGVVVSPDERNAFVPLAEERIRVMLVDDLRPALGVTYPE